MHLVHGKATLLEQGREPFQSEILDVNIIRKIEGGKNFPSAFCAVQRSLFVADLSPHTRLLVERTKGLLERVWQTPQQIESAIQQPPFNFSITKPIRYAQH